MPLQSLLESLHARVPRMHELTRAWVELNSYTKNISGVNACGAGIADAFRMDGLTLRVEPGGPGSGDHLFWSTETATSEPAILLIGHHDTVFPPGHFEGYRVAEGRGYGPGCLDMKGGLALVWGVVSTLAEAGRLRDLPLGHRQCSGRRGRVSRFRATHRGARQKRQLCPGVRGGAPERLHRDSATGRGNATRAGQRTRRALGQRACGRCERHLEPGAVHRRRSGVH